MPLRHEVAGSGPPVLLIHAGACDSRMWDPQWDDLQRDHTVIRADMPGFGRSAPPAGPYVIAEHLVDILPPEPVAVVAASFGGAVALELAGLYPDRVSQLVLLAPDWEVELSPDIEVYYAEEDSLLQASDHDAVVALNVRTWLGPDASEDTKDLVAEMQRANLAHDGDPQEAGVDVATIAAPTVIFTGAHDFDHFRGVAQHLVATMPHAEHTELEWAGHLPSLERPGEMTQLIRASLARSR